MAAFHHLELIKYFNFNFTQPQSACYGEISLPFDVIVVKIGAMVLALASWKNPQTKKAE